MTASDHELQDAAAAIERILTAGRSVVDGVREDEWSEPQLDFCPSC